MGEETRCPKCGTVMRKESTLTEEAKAAGIEAEYVCDSCDDVYIQLAGRLFLAPSND